MITSGTIKLPYDDPMTGVMGTWSLDTGDGPRSYVSPDIQFVPPSGGAGSPFGSPPTVVLSLAGIGASGGPVRVALNTESVQAEEFNIRVTVNGDCTLHLLYVTWLAYDGV